VPPGQKLLLRVEDGGGEHGGRVDARHEREGPVVEGRDEGAELVVRVFLGGDAEGFLVPGEGGGRHGAPAFVVDGEDAGWEGLWLDDGEGIPVARTGE